MSQILKLPINDWQTNADWKSGKYMSVWGYPHFGADAGSVSKQRNLYGMGNGYVVSCGLDGYTTSDRLGYATVIVYKDVLLNDGKTVVDLACRIYHQSEIKVKAGDSVTAETIIGVYGSTGANSSGPHLHIEFDTDTKYPQYAVGIKSSGRVIKKGSVDSTVDPMKVFWIGDGQSVTIPQSYINDGWVRSAWRNLPTVPVNKPNYITLEQLALKLKKEGIESIMIGG